MGEKNGGRRNGKCKLRHREREDQRRKTGGSETDRGSKEKRKTERQIEVIRRERGGKAT
jgi:hypothetical protein